MPRSGSGISAIFASTSLSPSALPPRAAARRRLQLLGALLHRGAFLVGEPRGLLCRFPLSHREAPPCTRTSRSLLGLGGSCHVRLVEMDQIHFDVSSVECAQLHGRRPPPVPGAEQAPVRSSSCCAAARRDRRVEELCALGNTRAWSRSPAPVARRSSRLDAPSSSATAATPYYVVDLAPLQQLLADAALSLHPALGSTAPDPPNAARLRTRARTVPVHRRQRRSQIADAASAEQLSSGALSAASAGSRASRSIPTPCA